MDDKALKSGRQGGAIRTSVAIGQQPTGRISRVGLPSGIRDSGENPGPKERRPKGVSDRGVKNSLNFVPYLQHGLEKPSVKPAGHAFGVARRCGLDMVLSADGGRLLFVLA